MQRTDCNSNRPACTVSAQDGKGDSQAARAAAAAAAIGGFNFKSRSNLSTKAAVMQFEVDEDLETGARSAAATPAFNVLPCLASCSCFDVLCMEVLLSRCLAVLTQTRYDYVCLLRACHCALNPALTLEPTSEPRSPAKAVPSHLHLKLKDSACTACLQRIDFATTLQARSTCRSSCRAPRSSKGCWS